MLWRLRRQALRSASARERPGDEAGPTRSLRGQLERELRGLPGDHPNRAIVEGYLEQVRILRRATLEEMHHATIKKIDGGIERMLGEGDQPEEARRRGSRRPV